MYILYIYILENGETISIYIYSWKFPDISLTCFCKIPWFSPDFTHFSKFPDFSLQVFFFHKIPCFPWFFPGVGTLLHVCGWMFINVTCVHRFTFTQCNVETWKISMYIHKTHVHTHIHRVPSGPTFPTFSKFCPHFIKKFPHFPHFWDNPFWKMARAAFWLKNVWFYQITVSTLTYVYIIYIYPGKWGDYQYIYI